MFRRGLVVLKGKMAWAVSFVAVGTSCAVVGSYDFDGYRSELSGVGGGPMGTLDCGDSCHDPGKTCGGGGTANRCGCTPTTCQAKNANCGMLPDGCGGMIDCKTCAPPAMCGGDGPNRCGTTPCVAKTCAELGAACGAISDGCSKILDCGNNCASPQTCGGGDTPNKCGCKPVTCPLQGQSCG